MAKVFIAIDGGNFYHKLRSKEVGLRNLLEFDYREFIKWLAKKNKVVDCCYYVGQIREEAGNTKSRNLKRDQDKLFTKLKKQGIRVQTGYILKSKNQYREKGVDVHIAVDVCMKAVRNEYDRLILVSSDTDLIPAIKEVKTLKKYVEYVGFDFSPSFAMIRFSDSRTLLKKEDLSLFKNIKKK
jgi:uncharacterized LabA/DUF88 family protein